MPSAGDEGRKARDKARCHTPAASLVLECMNERIVILGGGYAGAMAAARMARQGVPVTLIDAKDALV